MEKLCNGCEKGKLSKGLRSFLANSRAQLFDACPALPPVHLLGFPDDCHLGFTVHLTLSILIDLSAKEGSHEGPEKH